MRSKMKMAPLALAALFAAQASAAEQIVKIGVSGPLSGANAFAGKDNENGVRLAVEELNAQKIQVGGNVLRFVLQSEDDAGDPKQGVNVAQKFADAGVKYVLGPYNSGVAIPASRVYNDNGILMSTVGTNPKITAAGYPTVFRIVASDTQVGASVAGYAAKELKVKNVGVIDDRTAFGQGIAMEFKRQAQKAGIKVAGHEFTNDKASDFSAILTSLRAKKVDAIFFGGYAPQGAPMARQMKQLGLNVRMMGGDGICSDEIHKLSGGTMQDGQVVCAEAGGVQGEAKAGMDKFRADYRKRFGIDVQINAPYAYDATMAMAEAMVKAGSSAPAKYLPVLAQIQYQGITGPIAFDARGDIRDGTITLYTFKGGKRSMIAVTK